MDLTGSHRGRGGTRKGDGKERDKNKRQGGTCTKIKNKT